MSRRANQCAVCGDVVEDCDQTHRCSKASLDSIDRADRAAWDQELDPTRYEASAPSVVDQTLEDLLALGALG